MAVKKAVLSKQAGNLFISIAKMNKFTRNSALKILTCELEYRIQMREREKYIKKLSKLKQQCLKLFREADAC